MLLILSCCVCSPALRKSKVGAALSKAGKYGSEGRKGESEIASPLAGDCKEYQGRIIAFNSETNRHLVLWEDGEDEWIDIQKEVLTWHADRSKSTGFSAGLPAGWSVSQGTYAQYDMEWVISITQQSLLNMQVEILSCACDLFVDELSVQAKKARLGKSSKDGV